MIISHTYTSQNPWPHLLIFWAIHGDEPCGTIAIQKLIQELESWKTKLNAWSLTLLPICNPRAYDTNKRYVEKNLNRVFTKHKNPTSYEQQLANELTVYVDQCDILLDIHSAGASWPPNVFQDYLTTENEILAKATGIELIIQWRPEVYAAQENISYDTIWYAHNKGKKWVLVECGQHLDKNAPNTAYTAIRNIMHHLDICIYDKHHKRWTSTSIHMKQLIQKTKEGTLTQERSHGQEVKQWEIIAIYIDREEIKAPYSWYIVLPNNKAKIWDERFYIWK